MKAGTYIFLISLAFGVSAAHASPRKADPTACRSLEPGEYRDISGRDLPPALRKHSTARYRLIRSAIERDTYRVILNPEFSFIHEEAGQKVELRRGEAGWQGRYDAAITHVRDCYDQVNPTLIGPQGERLNLEVYDASASDAVENFGAGAPAPWKVRIYSYDIERDDSGNWGAETQSQCETLIHESLHIAGLGDLYREKYVYYLDDQGQVTSAKTERSVPAYDCRVAAPTDSVMSSDTDAFMATLGQAHVKTWNVTPRGSGMMEATLVTALKTATPNRQRLLYPAEFNKIIQSNPCEFGQDTYSQCMVGAYDTSAIEGCPKLPAICTLPGYAWLLGGASGPIRATPAAPKAAPVVIPDDYVPSVPKYKIDEYGRPI